MQIVKKFNQECFKFFKVDITAHESTGDESEGHSQTPVYPSEYFPVKFIIFTN